MNFIALDFETASPQRHSAVSLGIAVVRDNQLVDEFYTLIQPATPFSARNTQIHGLTAQDVVDAPTFPEVWAVIKQFFTPEQLVIAHNAAFDNSVLQATLAHYQLPPAHYLSLDTVRTSRQFYPTLPNHKLDTVAKALGIQLSNHHHALADTVATAQILVSQAEQFGVAAIKPLVKPI